MAILLVKATARNGLQQNQRDALRVTAARVDLGHPAEYLDENGDLWYVYADGSITLEDAAVGARIMAHPGNFPDFSVAGSRAEVHAKVRDFAERKGVTMPRDIAFQEGEDPWERVLSENGAPSSMRMADGVPPGFTAVADVP